MKSRIGFACMRWHQIPGQKISTTTQKFMSQFDRDEQTHHLQKLAINNARSVLALVESVAAEPSYARMVRIETSVFPLYDHPDHTYEIPSLALCSLQKAGSVAKLNNIRLSFHTDQFIDLASDKPPVVDNSIRSLNHLKELVSTLDADVIIHCSGTLGPDAFKHNMSRLDPIIRAALVVANDEYQCDPQDLFDIGIPIVLDFHHYWVSRGKWPSRSLTKRIIDTWDRVPKFHYSYSRIIEQATNRLNTRPMFMPTQELQNKIMDRAHQVYTKSDLRSHSDLYPNRKINIRALREANYFDADIMCECKHKDLGRDQLIRDAIWIGLITSSQK